MRLLGWIPLFIFAKYKTVKDSVFETMTPMRWWVHGSVFLVTLIGLILVINTIKTTRTIDWVPISVFESCVGLSLYTHRITNGLTASVEWLYFHLIPKDYFPQTEYASFPLFFKIPIMLRYRLPEYLTLVLFAGILFLIPQLAIWLEWKRKWLHLTGLLLFCYVSFLMMQYHYGYCGWQFSQIHERLNTNISKQELYRHCGSPLTWRYSTRWDDVPRWEGLYTNGGQSLTVFFKNDGTVGVMGIVNVWLD